MHRPALLISLAMASTACRPVEVVDVTVVDCGSKSPITKAQVNVEFGPAGFGNQAVSDEEGRAEARFPKEKPSRLVVEAEGYRFQRKEYRRPPEKPVEVCLEPSGSEPTTSDDVTPE